MNHANFSSYVIDSDCFYVISPFDLTKHVLDIQAHTLLHNFAIISSSAQDTDDQPCHILLLQTDQ